MCRLEAWKFSKCPHSYHEKVLPCAGGARNIKLCAVYGKSWKLVQGRCFVCADTKKCSVCSLPHHEVANAACPGKRFVFPPSSPKYVSYSRSLEEIEGELSAKALVKAADAFHHNVLEMVYYGGAGQGYFVNLKRRLEENLKFLPSQSEQLSRVPVDSEDMRARDECTTTTSPSRATEQGTQTSIVSLQDLFDQIIQMPDTEDVDVEMVDAHVVERSEQGSEEILQHQINDGNYWPPNTFLDNSSKIFDDVFGLDGSEDADGRVRSLSVQNAMKFVSAARDVGQRQTVTTGNTNRNLNASPKHSDDSAHLVQHMRSTVAEKMARVRQLYAGDL